MSIQISEWRGGLMMEYHQVIDELCQGMEKARQLGVHLHGEEDQGFLVQRIISSLERALLILKADGIATPRSPTSILGASSVSAHRNSGRCKDVRNGNGTKKRKLQPTRTELIRVGSASRFEGPAEDVYTWRKYGQKNILGAKYPRSYYRCTYRHSRNCLATKQAQRSDDDRSVFEFKYKGTHSCNGVVTNSVPTCEQNLEKKSNDSFYHQGGQQNDMLLNMKANLKVETPCSNMEDMEGNPWFTIFASNEEEKYCSLNALFDDSGSYGSSTPPVDDNQKSSYSSPLPHSPATSRANYYNETAYQKGDYGIVGLHEETQVPEAVSVHASTTISPSEGMDEVALDPSYLIDIPDIFKQLSEYAC